jgi:hypothetical protein
LITIKSGRGGKRPGAGRPKKVEQLAQTLAVAAVKPAAKATKQQIENLNKGRAKRGSTVVPKADAPWKNPAAVPQGTVAAVKATLKATAAECRAIAMEYCPEVIRGYGELWRDQDQPLSVRLLAANQLLDRGIGKAAQPVHHADANGEAFVFEEIDGDALELAATRLIQAIESAKAGVPAGRDDGAVPAQETAESLH